MASDQAFEGKFEVNYRSQPLFSTDVSLDLALEPLATDYNNHLDEPDYPLGGLHDLSLNTLKRQTLVLPPVLDVTLEALHAPMKQDPFLGLSPLSTSSDFPDAVSPMTMLQQTLNIKIEPDTPNPEPIKTEAEPTRIWQSSEEWQKIENQLVQLQQFQMHQMARLWQPVVTSGSPNMYNLTEDNFLPIPMTSATRSVSLSPHMSPEISPNLLSTSFQGDHQRSLSAVSVASFNSNASESQTLDRVSKIQCHICGKQFTRRYNLQGHLRAHRGERPFECQVCPTSFTRKADLERHKKKHTKDDDDPLRRSRTLSRGNQQRNHDRQVLEVENLDKPSDDKWATL